MAEYCADCGAAVGAADNFCPACGSPVGNGGERRQPSATPTTSVSSRWHVGVAFPLLATVGMLVVSFSIGFLEGAGAIQASTTEGWIDVVGALWSLAMLFSVVVSPASVYFDRRHLTRTVGWTPSRAYYLAVIPGVNLLVGAAYLWQRHRALADPAPAPADASAGAGPSP